MAVIVPKWHFEHQKGEFHCQKGEFGECYCQYWYLSSNESLLAFIKLTYGVDFMKSFKKLFEKPKNCKIENRILVLGAKKIGAKSFIKLTPGLKFKFKLNHFLDV